MYKPLYAFMLACSLGCLGQEPLLITGKVIDSETRSPLPFATISLKNTSQGVVANENGVFDLIVTQGEAIVISTLGYTPKSFDLEAIQSSGQTHFALTNQPIILEEVIVSGQKEQLSGEAILKQAIKNQKKNFPSDNYALSVFFRETNQLNDQYAKLVEAAATIYGKKYPNTSKKVYIDEIRKVSRKDSSLPTATEGAYNPFREFQSLIGRVGNVRACKSCKYELEGYTSDDGSPAAIISSVGPDNDYPRVFRYYVNLDTYAVIRMEFESKVPFGMGFPSSYENYNSSLVYLKRTFDYKSYHEKYYLSRYHQQVTHEYRSVTDSLDDYQTTHHFSVITNNIQLATEAPVSKENLMSYKDQIGKASQSYDPDFWKKYNVLKETPLNQKIIDDLEAGQSPDSLFSKEK